MTVYFDKKRRKWRYDFELAGERHAAYAIDPATKEPATSKRAAQAAEDAARVRARIAPKVPRAGDTTLAMAIADLAPEWQLQSRAANIKTYVREIAAFFGPAMPVADFNQAQVDDYVSFARTRTITIWKGGPARDPRDPKHAHFWKDSGRLRSNRTVNLYLEILRQIVERAGKLRDSLTGEAVLRDPPQIPTLKKLKRKARPVPEAILSELMAALPAHATEALIATLFFGFRQGEIFALTTADVDFEMRGVWFRAEAVKDKEDEFLPGGPEAMAFMRRLADQAAARGQKHLITYRAFYKDAKRQEAAPWRPIKNSRRAWRRVMQEVERRHGRKWRWHDIRAAFITHVAVTAGQLAAQTLARHADYATTRMYVEVADDIRRAAADKVSRRPSLSIVNGGRSPTQKSHTSPAAKTAKRKKPA